MAGQIKWEGIVDSARNAELAAKRKRGKAFPLALRAGQVSALFFAFPEAISHAANRLDQVHVPELPAQRFDVNVDGPFQNDSAVADGGVHQLMPRESAARLAKQALQQPEFRRRQLQLAPAHGDTVPRPVDVNVKMFDHVRRFAPASKRRWIALMRCSSTLMLNGLVT